ncbi:hypothetical protein E2C01_057327 [Portunus trituberculatus]|uniref:Uncharacterized protein n=1 Tax=Portunus trituberculatus TaxID=210409 RepID=A0A5B7GZR0_PORTR|nr:hypothetical protein [Portunus trituberculatus]
MIPSPNQGDGRR